MSCTPTPYFAFDVTAFRTMFPAFANNPPFTDAMLQMYWDWGNSYIANDNYGWLNCANKLLALNMITAHLVQLSTLPANQVPGLVQNATIDKVTVGLTPPPIPNQWRWWLQLTKYGQELLALLQAQSIGGFFAGPYDEISAFRINYGVFP